MAKFLSNDRKVIFLSATTGTLLISILSRVLFIDNMFIWLIGGVGFLAIYWNVPTWFSHNRQLVKDNGKFFNAEGEEVTNKFSRERLICILLFFEDLDLPYIIIYLKRILLFFRLNYVIHLP